MCEKRTHTMVLSLLFTCSVMCHWTTFYQKIYANSVLKAKGRVANRDRDIVVILQKVS